MSLIVSVNGVYQTYIHPEKGGENTSQKPLKRKANSTNSVSSQYEKISNNTKRERKNIFARDIMSKKLHSMEPEISIIMAMNYMLELKIHHLLVLKDNELKGIVSDRDLLKSLNRDNNHRITLEDIMSEKVILCKEETEIRLIAKTMLDEGISSLPVIDDDKVLTGIITKADLLECIYKNMPLDIWI